MQLCVIICDWNHLMLPCGTALYLACSVSPAIWNDRVELQGRNNVPFLYSIEEKVLGSTELQIDFKHIVFLLDWVHRKCLQQLFLTSYTKPHPDLIFLCPRCNESVMAAQVEDGCVVSSAICCARLLFTSVFCQQLPATWRIQTVAGHLVLTVSSSHLR